MEGRLVEHLEDKLFFHYPHLDNTAKDYSWIAAPVVIPFMVVVVVLVITLVVKAYGHRHHKCSATDMPTETMEKRDMGYALTCMLIIVKLFCI